RLDGFGDALAGLDGKSIGRGPQAIELTSRLLQPPQPLTGRCGVLHALKRAVEGVECGGFLPFQIAFPGRALRGRLDGLRWTLCDGLTRSLAAQQIPKQASERQERDYPIRPPGGGWRRA